MVTTTKLVRILPVAVTLLAAACSSSGRHQAATPETTATTTAPTTSAPSTTTAAPPAIPTGSTTTTPVAGATLPHGFNVVDMTWISDNEGWALGVAPCTTPPCTSLAHTRDGGRTWAGSPAPKAYLQNDPTAGAVYPCTASVSCVGGVRFADATTGYAFGVSSLWLTTDGARTWSLRSTDGTDSLEIVHGTVVRLTHPEAGFCAPGCTYRVQSAAVGSTSWQMLSPSAVTGDASALAVEGSNRYVAAFGHVAGGAQDAHTKFLRSTDSGAHWSSLADPCGTTPSGNEADASALAAGAGGFLAVGCTARQAGEAGFAVVSADAGATFGPHRGGLLGAVPSDGERVEAVAAATGQRLAVLVIGNASRSIAVTNDAGADWTVTHAEAATNVAVPYLGFQDATTGRAILSPGAVLTTTDGGGHWTPFAFP
jgi:photosystem II stability/assembly factor-like uncharacterized protein